MQRRAGARSSVLLAAIFGAISRDPGGRPSKAYGNHGNLRSRAIVVVLAVVLSAAGYMSALMAAVTTDFDASVAGEGTGQDSCLACPATTTVGRSIGRARRDQLRWLAGRCVCPNAVTLDVPRVPATGAVRLVVRAPADAPSRAPSPCRGPPIA